MKEIIILSRKDLQLLIFDKTSLVVTFALPLVLIALVGSAFSTTFARIGISSYDYAFSKVMFWGLIGGAASSVASIAVEKNSGTMIRLQAAPIKKIEILLGKCIACLAVLIVSSAASWLFATLLFGVKTSSMVWLILTFLSNAVFFTGLMTFLANFVSTERAAGALSWSVLQVLACFSGITFPLTFMPSWMVSITNINPVTWGVKAMEMALWKEAPFTEMLLPVAIPLLSGIFFFGISSYIFKMSLKK